MNDEKYNYKQAVHDDIMDYLKEQADGYITKADRDRLYDDMFVADSVTGNGSGSYTFSTWKAEGYLCHNEDLREECAEEFGIDTSDGKTRGAEYWDVSIRCMLLGRLIGECVEAWNAEHPEADDDGEKED